VGGDQQVGGPCLAWIHVGESMAATAGQPSVITTFRFEMVSAKSVDTQTLCD
jgi:hypothetical protein